ncbi:uncharacterized protein METZ01_LOCUS146854, partial [marine metagenome]
TGGGSPRVSSTPTFGTTYYRHEKAQIFVIWAFHIWPFGLVLVLFLFS